MRSRSIPLFPIVVLLALLALFIAPAGATGYNPDVCAGYVPEDGDINPDCLAMMDAFPAPVVVPISADTLTLSSYSYWRIGPQAVNLYDAPNGNVVGQMPSGFNFAVAIDTSVDGWVQIQGGQWVQDADAKYVPASYFRGVRLLDGLEYPFAWILDTNGMYTSDYPGGPQDPDNGKLVLRYDLVNIFSQTTDSDGWIWYMIGPNQWINQKFVAVEKRTERPDGVSGRWAAIDLYEQTLVAYEDDTPVFATLVATGLPQWETPEGIYTVWARVARDGMSGATGAPDAYALQSVPWVMYFNQSISLHGTYWHDLFGYRHSHGCVNLSISDAHFLYDWTAGGPPDKDGNVTTYVYVYASGDYR